LLREKIVKDITKRVLNGEDEVIIIHFTDGASFRIREDVDGYGYSRGLITEIVDNEDKAEQIYL
jgi:hypothetical protein